MNDTTIKLIASAMKTLFAELAIDTKHPHQKELAVSLADNVFKYIVSTTEKKEQDKNDKPKQVTVNTTAPVVIKELKKEVAK